MVRGNARYTAGVMDFLNIVPMEDGLKGYLLDTATAQIKALSKLQHEDGMWHTVLDDSDSYKETSATAAFGYGILKGIRYGYLDDSYRHIGMKAFASVLHQLIKTELYSRCPMERLWGSMPSFIKAYRLVQWGMGKPLRCLF